MALKCFAKNILRIKNPKAEAGLKSYKLKFLLKSSQTSCLNKTSEIKMNELFVKY